MEKIKQGKLWMAHHLQPKLDDDYTKMLDCYSFQFILLIQSCVWMIAQAMEPVKIIQLMAGNACVVPFGWKIFWSVKLETEKGIVVIIVVNKIVRYIKIWPAINFRMEQNLCRSCGVSVTHYDICFNVESVLHF